MSPIRRLVEEGDAFERELLRSAQQDEMSPSAARELLAVVRAGGTGSMAGEPGRANATQADASPIKASTGAAAKWAALAVAGMASIALVTVRAPLIHPRTPSAAPPVAPSAAVGMLATADPVAPILTALPEPLAPTVMAAPGVASAPGVAPTAMTATARTNARPRAAVDPAPVGDTGAASSLAAELKWVERARASLGAGGADEALRLLDQYRSQFAHGALEDETEVLRIEAYTRTGATAKASELAREFLANRRPGPYTPRVQRALVALSREKIR